jgi:hypothetical protein
VGEEVIRLRQDYGGQEAQRPASWHPIEERICWLVEKMIINN